MAKSAQQAANEAMGAATAAAIASTNVSRIRSKQLVAAALDESVPLTAVVAEGQEAQTVE